MLASPRQGVRPRARRPVRRHASAIFAGLDAVTPGASVIEGCATLDREMDDDELRAPRDLRRLRRRKSPWFPATRVRSPRLLPRPHACDLPAADVGAGRVRRARLPARHHRRLEPDRGTARAPLALEWERVEDGPVPDRAGTDAPAALGGVGPSPACSTSGWTVPVSAGLRAQRSRPRLGSWPPPRSTRRCARRGHIATRSSPEAARHCSTGSCAGRLEPSAVDAVLAAAGHGPAPRRTWSAGLSAREAEVLALLVRGLPNKQIAARLSSRRGRWAATSSTSTRSRGQHARLRGDVRDAPRHRRRRPGRRGGPATIG